MGPPLRRFVDVAAGLRNGHGHAPEPRLPLARRAVLRSRRPSGPLRLGRAAPLAGFDPAGRRPWTALVPPHHRLAGHPGPRRLPRLHAQPLRPRLHRPHLRDPAAVGGTPVDARPDGPGAADAGMAASGALRPRHPHDRRCQRHLAAPRRPRPGALDRMERRRGHGRLAESPRRIEPNRVARARNLHLVGHRPPDPGRLRSPHPSAHRDLRGDRRRRNRPRIVPWAGVLVLLRPGQARCLDRACLRIHALGASPLLRPPAVRPSGGCRDALPVPEPSAPAFRRRDARRRCRPSVRCSLAARTGLQGVDDHGRRPGDAQHAPRSSARGARYIGLPGRRGGSTRAAHSPLPRAPCRHPLPGDPRQFRPAVARATPGEQPRAARGASCPLVGAGSVAG